MNYKTQDFYVAIALRALNFDMTMTRDGRKITFVFEGENIEEKVNDYWNGKIMVDAKEYSTAVKDMKCRVHDALD